MKDFIKKILPVWLLNLYYLSIARLSAVIFGFPSRHMIVVGVTGTNGKSSTVSFLAQILRNQGKKVGMTSTALFSDGDHEWLNGLKMTMPGRFFLQKFLRVLRRNNCDVAIIETSSEGIKQYRHIGIEYDVAVMTNLTSEHLESHGGFEHYKEAKGKLFELLSKTRQKTIHGKRISKSSVVYLDDPHADYFLSFRADKKFGTTFQGETKGLGSDDVLAVRSSRLGRDGARVRIDDRDYPIPLIGLFQAKNALLAGAAAMSLGCSKVHSLNALATLKPVPGRMEYVDVPQSFSVIVDYAPEPESLKNVFQTIEAVIPHQRIIHVLGSTGGGRDRSRRPILGQMSSEHADIVIITNEDPYDDDPQTIIDEVFEGTKDRKQEGVNVFRMSDRRSAISCALSKAKANDLVLVTGKGCEQAIVSSHGKKIPWDDRRVIIEQARKLKKNGDLGCGKDVEK